MHVNVRPVSRYNVFQCSPIGIKEDLIMMKSLLTGMAVCAALAVFAGSGNAANNPSTRTINPDQREQISPVQVQDCVHVTFPQCGNSGY